MNTKEAFSKIQKFFEKQGRMPTISEVMELFRYKSRNSAFYTINKLIKEKYLKKDTKGKLVITGAFESLPLVGVVPAGFASPVDEALSESISVSDYLIRNKEASYILQVKGDSMRDAGINDGDMVVFERTADVKPGDMVVALIEDGYTLKYLMKEKGGKLYLQPANPDYPKMYPKEGQIAGVVVSVFRKIKK